VNPVVNPDDHHAFQVVLINTAKTHSPLFVKLTTNLLSEKPTKDIRTRAIVSRKRKQLRRKKSKRLVFNELDNIYRPKPYTPKMIATTNNGIEKGGTEWSENLNMTLICKDCKEVPPNLVEEFSSGDMVCGSCGLVLGDRIVDTRSEWRTFSNDDQGNDDPSRVGDGANPLLNGSQLQTTIAYTEGSARSRDLLRAQGKSSTDKATKGLLAAYKEIGAHCDAVNIPKNVSDTAKHLFKLVDDAKAFKGKSQEAIIAGCIFIACRQCGVPRTFREIYALTKVSKKDIGRTFKALEKFFAQDSAGKVAMASAAGGKFSVSAVTVLLFINSLFQGVLPSTDTYQTTTSTNAKDLCLRYCSQLGLNRQQFVKVSQGLAEKMSTVGDLAGRSPLSVAAACIYMASYLLGKPKTPKEISQVAGVSDGTIRTAYKYLYQERERLIEPEWIADGKGKLENLPVG
jgi:transcription initiation factor TFIIB